MPVTRVLYAQFELRDARTDVLFPVVLTACFWLISFCKDGESMPSSVPDLCYNCGMQLLSEVCVDLLIREFGPPKPALLAYGVLCETRYLDCSTIVHGPGLYILQVFPFAFLRFAETRSGECVAIRQSFQ